MPCLLQPSHRVVIAALLAFAAVLVAAACSRTGRQVETGPVAAPAARPEPPAAPTPPPVDFATDVRPILEAGCRPCHFEGGVMYAKLPFDRPETIRHLGEMLFTRIDAPEDQATIRAFLAAGTE